MTDRTKICFIADGIVEFILSTPANGLPQMTSQEYTFVDKTEESPELLLGKFKYEITDYEGSTLEIVGDESLYSVLKSKMLSVEMPKDVDVKIGWLYNGIDFIEN